MTAYYNEIDPKAASWLRELIKQGHITPPTDGSTRTRLDQLPRQATLTDSGETPTGSTVVTKSTGQLNPAHSRLAHGAPARVGRLRGYGNALVAPLAQAFIASYLDICG